MNQRGPSISQMPQSAGDTQRKAGQEKRQRPERTSKDRRGYHLPLIDGQPLLSLQEIQHGVLWADIPRISG